MKTLKSNRDALGRRLFSTSETARILRVHPNTVRLYEKWKLIPPAERTPSGYRMFTRTALDQLKVIRKTFAFSVIPGDATKYGREILRSVGELRFSDALASSEKLMETLEAEYGMAVRAVELVRSWVTGKITGTPVRYLSRKDAAAALGVTRESLRTWERNGLIDVPRNYGNDYRVYGPEELDRLTVIRSLRKAGYGQQAILRMFTRLEREGVKTDIVDALDTPTDAEDMYCATNMLLTTLESLTIRCERLTRLLTALSSKYERTDSQNPS